MKAMDQSYAQKAVQDGILVVIPLILGGLLSFLMAMEIPLIRHMKDDSAPMLAIIMEVMTLVNMEIIWG